MSLTLINKGLELLDGDLTDNSTQLKGSSSKSKPSALNTQRHGLKKAALQKVRQQQRRKEARQQMIQKQVSSSVDKYIKSVNKDYTKQNLEALKAIDSKRVPKRYLEEIREQHSKQLDKTSVNPEIEKAKEEKSVFTDEDFEMVDEIQHHID